MEPMQHECSATAQGYGSRGYGSFDRGYGRYGYGYGYGGNGYGSYSTEREGPCHADSAGATPQLMRHTSSAQQHPVPQQQAALQDKTDAGGGHSGGYSGGHSGGYSWGYGGGGYGGRGYGQGYGGRNGCSLSSAAERSNSPDELQASSAVQPCLGTTALPCAAALPCPALPLHLAHSEPSSEPTPARVSPAQRPLPPATADATALTAENPDLANLMAEIKAIIKAEFAALRSELRGVMLTAERSSNTAAAAATATTQQEVVATGQQDTSQQPDTGAALHAEIRQATSGIRAGLLQLDRGGDRLGLAGTSCATAPQVTATTSHGMRASGPRPPAGSEARTHFPARNTRPAPTPSQTAGRIVHHARVPHPPSRVQAQSRVWDRGRSPASSPDLPSDSASRSASYDYDSVSGDYDFVSGDYHPVPDEDPSHGTPSDAAASDGSLDHDYDCDHDSDF